MTLGRRCLDWATEGYTEGYPGTKGDDERDRDCVSDHVHSSARGACSPPRDSRLSGKNPVVLRAWDQALPAEVRENAAAAAVWVPGRLRALEDGHVAGEADPEHAARRIVEVSLRFAIGRLPPGLGPGTIELLLP